MNPLSKKFPGKKILVVEDYFINQEVIKDILELMECEVAIAENGVLALEKIEKEEYDLVFLDIQMPEKDGYQVAKEIREKEDSDEHIPLIALTASALSGDREKCLKEGMDDYLSKPIEPYQIEEILDKYLKP
ncbi:MAG: response regulator [Waddliaceae bacterium]